MTMTAASAPPSSRAPLLTADQVAFLVNLKPSWVRRFLGRRLVVSPRQIRWRVEDVEELVGIQVSDQMLRHAGVRLTSQE